ncbi:phosphorothioated DNA-binding restriction endonuclease [Kribbella sp. NPDC003557]|uniref:phosphorothioated DNA-binding restriction endonuclease n=1 Tax=Kribbella sp. NPDC003557 TaxID=3154449 RepID=UPI0033B1E696
MANESPVDVVLERLSTLRQARNDGRRMPHKPLLVLLALARFAEFGSSALPWSAAQEELGGLIAEFGPPTRTGRRQSAAYPFTRLRSDGIWNLDRDVPMDKVGPLDAAPVTGRLDTSIEDALRVAGVIEAAARALVESQFPTTVASDVVAAVGLDPDVILGSALGVYANSRPRRSRAWPSLILAAWDYQCAFCGYDGRLGSSCVGLEAAHVRWFNLGGPDAVDNGLSLCSLHHKLFDRGALGLDSNQRVMVSAQFSARVEAARRVYDLHGHELRPRRGTLLPAEAYTDWHRHQVFKGEPLTD